MQTGQEEQTMSGLRKRIFGGQSNESSRTPSPVPSSPRPGSRDPSVDGRGDHVSVPRRKLEKLNSYVHDKKSPKGTRRRNAWVFGLGGLFGITLALFFAGSNDVIDFGALKEMNMDTFFDVLPAGLIRDAQKLQVGSSLIRQPLHVPLTTEKIKSPSLHSSSII